MHESFLNIKTSPEMPANGHDKSQALRKKGNETLVAKHAIEHEVNSHGSTLHTQPG
tara:strand:- start:6611 stop:6778 length:168 start_codon:yes stop_codon:yes gene_type:complete